MKPAKYPGSLSALQQSLLESIDAMGDGLFLTGGGALAGFYGSTRTTRDLDLFTFEPDVFRATPDFLRTSCQTLGAQMERLRAFPHFLRFRVTRDGEQTLVDFVQEVVPAVHQPQQPDGWRLLVDRPEEIAINKVCAIVGRGEPRDLLDLLFLRDLGVDLDEAVAGAAAKDGGVGPDTLLVALRGFGETGPSLPPDQHADLAELHTFWKEWLGSLRQDLLPPG